tara:strand:+ start:698 stop:1675 length:978 start_codon:yes stop_codon:yes gene_type:complete
MFKINNIPWNVGLTKNTNEKVREIAEKQRIVKKQLFKEGKLKIWIEGEHHSKETKLKISKANKGKLKSKEHRQNISKSKIGKPISEEHKRNIGKGVTGKNNGMYGKTHTKEVRKKLSQTKKQAWKDIDSTYNSKEFREKRSKYMREKINNPMSNIISRKKLSVSIKRAIEEGRLKVIGKGGDNPMDNPIHRQTQIRRLNEPEVKEKHIKNMLKGLMKRPTSLESKIIYLTTRYVLPLKYTGNGTYLVGYKNPDFIILDSFKNVLGLIEVHNNFPLHHPDNYKKERYNHFLKYGYHTLFLDDNDLLDENWESICLNKIQNFVSILS